MARSQLAVLSTSQSAASHAPLCWLCSHLSSAMDPAIAIAATRERRRQQNRLAAAASRRNRQRYLTELQQRIQQLTDDNQRLSHQLQIAQQLSSQQAAPARPHVAQAAIVFPPAQPASTSRNHPAVHSNAADPASRVPVVPLSAYPHHVDGTAALLYREWANLFAFEGIHSALQLAHRLRAQNTQPHSSTTHSHQSPLPVTFIAVDQNTRTLLGTATLDTHDLPSTHPYHSVTPWVSSVLVSEQWRGKGIAGSLVRGVEAEARKRGLGWLWLWTVKPASVAMYQHLGWQVIERVWMAEKAKHIFVMRKDLVEHTQPHSTHSPLLTPSSLLPPPQSPPQPSVDLGAVYERLECMVRSLADFEAINEFTRAAAEFARARLSALDAEQEGNTQVDGRAGADDEKKQTDTDETEQVDTRIKQ